MRFGLWSNATRSVANVTENALKIAKILKIFSEKAYFPYNKTRRSIAKKLRRKGKNHENDDDNEGKNKFIGNMIGSLTSSE